jgi:excisionase family DNA binding protein
MSEKLLTIREVSSTLGLTEKQVIDLAEEGTIPAYKVGGVYLRFKREQIDEYKKVLRASRTPQKAGLIAVTDAIKDFFYFNDFYLLSGLVIFALIYIVLFT